ncbi:peptide/nickel transport system substrate-binding protein/oligopeptide transport system substrate-binding protein [Solibacillus kalamii]|uniref:Hemin-binding lipoprotein n=2 Tax=Solibacillus TaxID=648800 RepID=K1L4D4_9BACL|nr:MULTISPECIES: ABC transporter substrate-binding protein [Solibacillus]AMO86910.1 peptide ABC transporter substrate-binding protein [Solibacillus silvestris]EKB45508.1 Hemin-binding lipoprotein [Solibacillus isronensis B3W22]MBM7665738.1 peptide/nickel transport system substrate-binding protein/oligopeptide transport system substrate-binding protein [Solibacillus kalamii]OBW51526.1 peptide ABC transporter substrate-binding protein [Solibacillus silvestris]OUZ38827.1 ABC transporter substrate
MRKGKLYLVSLMMLLIMSLFLAACGADDAETSSSETNNDSSTNTDSNTTDNSSSSTPQVLVFGRGADSVSLDPGIVTDGESFKVTQNVFETLLNFGEQDTTINPGLAKEWEVSEDGLTYTFQLQEGVKFHDGTDFNADAVIKNINRWKGGKEEDFYYFNSMFKAEGEDIIKDVTAEGDHTVVFTLSRPQAPFLKNLAMSPFGIGSPTAFEAAGDKFGDNPVGTGPFKFTDWKRNDSITIEKFEDYWQEGLPKLDKVIFRSIPDNSARLNELMAGNIDLADGINPSDGKTVEGDSTLQLIERPSMNIGYLGLTNTRAPFDNKLVRQAVNYAIDKQAIVDAFFEGRAEVAANPMPSSISGYNDAISPYPYDPEKAKSLLAEAGYDGKEIELWAMPVPRPYMPDGAKVAEVIQKNLEDVGIPSKIVTFEWATYLEKAKNGEADAFMLGWTGDNGDADNFIYTLLDKDNIGSNNYAFYSNEEVHELLIQAQSETDENVRNELYKKAQEIIHDDAPWVPLAHSTPLLAAKAGVKDFKPHPTGSDKLDKVSME